MIYKLQICCGDDVFEKEINFAVWQYSWWYERLWIKNRTDALEYIDERFLVNTQDIDWDKNVVVYNLFSNAFKFNNVVYIDGYKKVE